MNQKKEKVSIIVPIFNVEKYIKQCVDSLLNQEYENIEILLIDDGSTDKSGKIIDKYYYENKKVKIFHKKNGGLADARNFGLEKATGKYIAFVDGDDFVSQDYISSMVKNILENDDLMIVACGFSHYINNKVKDINYQNISKKYSEQEAQKFLNIIGYFNVSACNKLFKKEIFNSIQFPVEKKSEDWFIMYKLIEKSNGIYYNSDTKYFYRQRVGSITKSVNINFDVIDAAKEVLEYFYKNDYIKPYAVQSYAFASIGVYNALLRKKRKEEMKKIRKDILKYKNDIIYDELTKLRKIQLFLFLNNEIMYRCFFKLYESLKGRNDR